MLFSVQHGSTWYIYQLVKDYTTLSCIVSLFFAPLVKKADEKPGLRGHQVIPTVAVCHFICFCSGTGTIMKALWGAEANINQYTRSEPQGQTTVNNVNEIKPVKML